MTAAIQTTPTIDIVVFGKQGMGKSTTCNILIGAQDRKENNGIKELKATGENEVSIPEVRYFNTPDSSLTLGTHKCQVLSHGPIRVLDVPGFSDILEDDSNSSVSQRNLALIHNAIRVQKEHNLSFYRILYFLPQRGPIRKADRYLQDELEAFHKCWGSDVFKKMIIIATNDRSCQEQEFIDCDLNSTRETCVKALELIWNRIHPDESQPPCCPPLMYMPLSISTERLLTKIKDTESVELTIVSKKCTKCGWSVVQVNEFSFQVTNDIEAVTYSDSLCHPEMVPKYTLLQRIIGGICHILTLGCCYFCYSEPKWPGFTNSKKRCISCNAEPGRSWGCIKVDTEYDGSRQMVKHSF